MNRRTIAALFAALLLTACSAESPRFRTDTGAGDDASLGDGATMPAEDAGTGTPDAIPVRDTGDPRVDPDAACAMQTTNTTRAPMNLLIVLDRSGSMQGARWTAAVAGLTRLLNRLDDEARVGLMFFPALSNPDDEAGYRTPLHTIEPLARNRMRLIDELNRRSPSGGTPMACAMVGATAWYQSMFRMDGSRNVVLITDGEPTQECSGVSCGFDFNCLMNASAQAKARIQATVAAAARATPPIRTFVLGTPEATEAFLNNLAINGNTRRAPGCEATRTCHYSLGSATFEMDLDRALDEIRGRAATCEFRLMIDPSRVDTNLINVNYTPSAGAMPRLIPRDRTRTNGWDYSADMRSVILYGAICDEVRANTADGRIQILFGCPTVEPG